MEIVRGSDIGNREWRSPVLTIGNFDGVHVGHREIVRRVVDRAASNGSEGVALTFEPHPKAVLHRAEPPSRLTLPEERNRLLGELGLDSLVIVEPSIEFLQKTAEEFVKEIVVDGFGASAIVEGPDFRFGRDTGGDLAFLEQMGEKYGFEVEVVPPVFCDGRMVSSTMIRSLLQLGEVDRAAAALGRPYTVSGTVHRGAGRGHHLGFPTINITIPTQTLPQTGVYVARVTWDEGSASGMSYLGRRLTYKEDTLAFEVNLFDFEGNLYGKPVAVEFLHYIREEMSFDKEDDLREQLKRDEEESRRYLAGLSGGGTPSPSGRGPG